MRGSRLNKAAWKPFPMLSSETQRRNTMSCSVAPLLSGSISTPFIVLVPEVLEKTQSSIRQVTQLARKSPSRWLPSDVRLLMWTRLVSATALDLSPPPTATCTGRCAPP